MGVVHLTNTPNANNPNGLNQDNMSEAQLAMLLVGTVIVMALIYRPTARRAV